MWVRISTILREATIISFKTEFQWQTDINQFNQHVQEKTTSNPSFSLCLSKYCSCETDLWFRFSFIFASWPWYQLAE